MRETEPPNPPLLTVLCVSRRTHFQQPLSLEALPSPLSSRPGFPAPQHWTCPHVLLSVKKGARCGERRRLVPACRGGTCGSADLPWECSWPEESWACGPPKV